MTTKEYLGQMKNIDRRIKDKVSDSRKWYDIATSRGNTATTPDKVQTSKKYDRMGDAIVKAMDYEQESIALSLELIELKHKITEQIEKVTDSNHYIMLRDYYIEQMSISEISRVEHFSKRHAFRLFNDALLEFETLFGSEYLEVVIEETARA